MIKVIIKETGDAYEIQERSYCGECRSEAQFKRTERIGARHYAIYECLRSSRRYSHLWRARLNP